MKGTVQGLIEVIDELNQGILAVLGRNAYIARNLPYMDKETIALWLGNPGGMLSGDAPDFPDKYSTAVQALFAIAGWSQAEKDVLRHPQYYRDLANQALMEMGIALYA